MSASFALPALAAGGVVGRADGALAITGAHHSAFVEYATWPPRVTVREDYMLDAARAPSGAWLAYMRHGHATWSLRWFRAATDTLPFATEPEPIPSRDIEPLLGELAPAMRRIELAHVHRIESVHACGELAVCVPRHVGLGELRLPFVRRDGVWHEASELPPFSKDELRARCCVAALRLGDGSDVLVWDGHVFADDGTQLVRRFEQRLGLAWYRPFAPVAWGRDRMFACSDDTLVELGPDGLHAHLPGTSAHGVLRGPGETLIVAASGGTLLYTPATNDVATITPELLGRDGDVIGTCGDDLVAYDMHAYQLRRIAAADLAALPRRHGAQPPASVPSSPVAELDDGGAASRALIAGTGDDIVVALGDTLRIHHGDRVRGQMRVQLPIVAVAHDGATCVALTERALYDITHQFSDEPQRSLRSLELQPIATGARSLARGPGDSWLVLTPQAAFMTELVPPRIKTLGFELPLAAATDPLGTILLAGERRRLATWCDGELVDVPPVAEQIIAIVALGPGRFACAGERHLFAFDIARRELELLSLPGKNNDTTFATVSAPFLAASGTRVAWCRAGRTIQLATIAGERAEPIDSITYPSIYSGTDDVTLTIRGLAFLSPDRLAIALDHGRGNIVDVTTKSALRFDPLPDDSPGRWILNFAGKTLIAD